MTKIIDRKGNIIKVGDKLLIKFTYGFHQGVLIKSDKQLYLKDNDFYKRYLSLKDIMNMKHTEYVEKV